MLNPLGTGNYCGNVHKSALSLRKHLFKKSRRISSLVHCVNSLYMVNIENAYQLYCRVLVLIFGI